MTSFIKKFFLFSLFIVSSLLPMKAPLSVKNPKDLVSIFKHQETILNDLSKILPIIISVFPGENPASIYLTQKTIELKNITKTNRFYIEEINTLSETWKNHEEKYQENIRKSTVILEESKELLDEQNKTIMKIKLLKEKNKYSFSFCQTFTLMLLSASIGAYFF